MALKVISEMQTKPRFEIISNGTMWSVIRHDENGSFLIAERASIFEANICKDYWMNMIDDVWKVYHPEPVDHTWTMF